MSTDASESGRLSIAAMELRYDNPRGLQWTLPVGEIAIVAEYTDEGGPVLDDYYYTFIRTNGDWVTASFYAEGAQVTMVELSHVLGGPLVASLCNQGGWVSRVMWPPVIAGRAAFSLTADGPVTLRERATEWLIALRSGTMSLSGEVRDYLGLASVHSAS